MRWKYFEPGNVEEERDRAAIGCAIRDWWDAFAKNSASIKKQFARVEDFDIVAFMQRHLSPVASDLCWEFGPGVKQSGDRLIFTSEGSKYLRPLICELLKRAPALPGWEFFEYRLPEDLEQSISWVKCRNTIDPTFFSVCLSLAMDKRINLEFAAADGAGADPKDVRTSGFLLTERLLGEELLDKWIGGMDGLAKDPRQPGKKFIPIDRLRPTVLAMIDAIREQLPAEPVHRWIEKAIDPAKPKGAVLKLPPPPKQDDYPGWSDLFVASTRNVDLWRATHESRAFYSERFSRCGETFCYLKIDGTKGLDRNHFADRGEIEDAINTSLAGLDCGCVLGGGTGLMYSYIDLAVTDVQTSISEIRRILRAGNISSRAWLLFFENGLEHEWVGIWDYTPPPPILKC